MQSPCSVIRIYILWDYVCVVVPHKLFLTTVLLFRFPNLSPVSDLSQHLLHSFRRPRFSSVLAVVCKMFLLSVTFKWYSIYAYSGISETFFQYPPFLGAFTKLRESSIIFVMSVRQSALVVSLCSWKTGLPTEAIFMEFGIRGFSKIYRENSSLNNTWQEWRALHMKTNIHLWQYLPEFFVQRKIF